MEEAHSSNNPKVLRDRMAKTILEIQKQVKSLQRVQGSHEAVEAELNKVRGEIQTSLNKKQMLYNLCMALLDKNHDLYLQHESMLEEERVERQSLAANFQDQMKDVSIELEAQKVKRTEEITENQEIRTLIQSAITDYKKKEESYRGKMDQHGKFIQNIEKRLKDVISDTISKPLQEAEKAKASFLKACENVKELSVRINGFMEKFDKIKDDMNENGRKFESYQSQVETKKLEI